MEILVLSEDSGAGFETVASILSRLLQVHSPTGQQQVKMMPAEDRTVREAAYANLWKSGAPKDQHKKVSLRRTIATKLAAGVHVFFHYDGDTTWSERKQSLTPRQFDKDIRLPVSQLLTPANATAIERLVEVTPHYSIEAWTYQATDTAVELCRSHHSGRDVTKFEEWARDRGALDEVRKPKEATCLGNRHNATLAQHVPCREMLAADKSFAELSRRIHRCEGLTDLLRFPSGKSDTP